jgi:hypothetical protein
MVRKPFSVRVVRSSVRSRIPTAVAAVSILLCCALFSASAKASCNRRLTAKAATALPEMRLLQTQTLGQERLVSTEEDEDASIVGLWHVLFVSGGQTFDEGYDQWHSDGTEVLNDTAPPQPANGAGTICLGVYKKTGPRTYKLKHPFWSFDTTGTLVGTGVILETVTVEESGKSYTGSFEFITYDLKGNVTSDTTGELKAERITVDSHIIGSA